MSGLRRLQREVVRNKCYKENGNYKNFKHEWEEFNYKRHESEIDGKIVSMRKRKGNKKKRYHFDDKRHFFNYYQQMKKFIEQKKEESKNKREEKQQLQLDNHRNHKGEFANG